MKRGRRLVNLCLIMLLVLSPITVAAQDSTINGQPGDQQVWVVNDYRYEAGTAQDDPTLGLSLCSTRCNAMTTDYRTVIDPGGYRFIRVAENRELVVELNNPYIGGHCICIADEYTVKIDEFNRPKK